MSQLVIGLVGLAGAGKSTAAKRLSLAHGFVRRPMAYRLKCMVGVLGLGPDVLDGDISIKETPHEALNGHTPRHAMQTLGTEWGRHHMGEDFWVELWMRDVRKLGNVVCDDVRFQNEVEAIRSLGGVIIRIERTGAGSKTNASHASEQPLLLPYDFSFSNDGTPSDLYDQIDRVVSDATSWSAKLQEAI